MSADDWSAIHVMSDTEIHKRAESDAAARALSKDRLAKARRVSIAKFVRQKLGMSQQQFATAYGIPIAILKAWERHELEPGPVEMSYLRAIERAPEATRAHELA